VVNSNVVRLIRELWNKDIIFYSFKEKRQSPAGTPPRSIVNCPADLCSSTFPLSVQFLLRGIDQAGVTIKVTCTELRQMRVTSIHKRMYDPFFELIFESSLKLF
jgi:hypothetical protein